MFPRLENIFLVSYRKRLGHKTFMKKLHDALAMRQWEVKVRIESAQRQLSLNVSMSCSMSDPAFHPDQLMSFVVS